MLDLAPNPYLEPIKGFISDLKTTKWIFPFIPQVLHLLITLFLILLLGILYATIGLISQISNSFWDLITGLGDRMNFSSPITSSFYALSISIYFVLFLPFFILQSPIWISGWVANKIGFKAFLILMLTLVVSFSIYYFQPDFSKSTINKIVHIHNIVKAEYFTSDTDSLNIIDESDFSSAEEVEK
jgi:hypothetical protein